MNMRQASWSRFQQIQDLLKASPNCYYTHHQISHALGLKTTPYTRKIIREVVAFNPHIHMIEVTAINGKMAWGYYYSQQQQQLALGMPECL